MGANRGYQFIAELKHFRPRIWRRFQIGSDLSLADLGYALVAMFEGCGGHLYHFYDKTKNTYYECDRYESPVAFGYTMDLYKSRYARGVKISRAFSKVGEKLEFEYDFGDSWTFNVKLEKIVPEVDAIQILSGARYGIVEDCGGIGGLSYIVELCKTRSGKEYEDFVEWSGLEEFDIEKFNIDDMNSRITEEMSRLKDYYEGKE